MLSLIILAHRESDSLMLDLLCANILSNVRSRFNEKVHSFVKILKSSKELTLIVRLANV